jgi:hypothetical protein
MFLEKRTYVKNWDYMQPENRHEVSVLKGGKPTKVQSERIKWIVEEVAYWRKANAIHQWFVENVQEDNDDCKEYWVSEEQLRELLSLCTQVLEASKLVDGEVTNRYTFENGKRVPSVEKGKVIEDPSTAKSLLPTQAGFFFGGTDYDESYLEDIQYTKDVLERALAGEPGGDYYYHASW